MTELKHHPAADVFPMFDKARHAELVEDICEHGQLNPITLCDGMILDGRNRYKACVELGVKPKTKTYEGDPWAYAWSLNGQRRDLADFQRGAIKCICDRGSDEWNKKEGKRLEKIKAEANKKRSEKAKEQPRSDDGKRLAKKDQVVVQDEPPTDKHKGRAATTSPPRPPRGRKEALSESAG